MPKSTVTLFTHDKHQLQTYPDITLEDTDLPLERIPKILGVIMDPSLSFHKHCTYVLDRIDKRNNLLKTRAGSSWGQEKEALNGYSKRVVGAPQSEGGGGAVEIYPASPESRPPSFFWEVSRATPLHGWRSAYSLRETLSPIQDQNQETPQHDTIDTTIDIQYNSNHITLNKDTPTRSLYNRTTWKTIHALN